ncbi:hypothetical protein BB8028_0007g02760 [Beauveria bassiana]|uniref:Uncharacterized protein n=1 Tax=Beauveria bassiana TaxID=176275 RepID=A0A2S7YLX0_BEABA|nr:hypothetical protein BB8028_0007g02760 [Beauveria bassiana]
MNVKCILIARPGLDRLISSIDGLVARDVHLTHHNHACRHGKLGIECRSCRAASGSMGARNGGNRLFSHIFHHEPLTSQLTRCSSCICFTTTFFSNSLNEFSNPVIIHSLISTASLSTHDSHQATKRKPRRPQSTNVNYSTITHSLP